MRNVVFIFSVVLFLFSSCEKEDLVDIKAIQSELAQVKSPEKWEFAEAVSKESLLKSASISLVEVFALDESTFEVTPEYAIKKFVYYKLDGNSEREDVLIMYQKFPVIKGKLDTSSYEIYYQIGSEEKESKWFKLNTKEMIICNVVCVFHFDNGDQFGYIGNKNEKVKLPNIAKGKWEIEVITYDSDITRRQTTGLVDFNKDYLLPLLVKPDMTNVAAKLVLSKEKIQNISTIRALGEDPKTGERLWMYIPVIYNESLPEKITFALPFAPATIGLISDTKWLEYGESDFIITKSGIPEYCLK